MKDLSALRYTGRKSLRTCGSGGRVRGLGCFQWGGGGGVRGHERATSFHDTFGHIQPQNENQLSNENPLSRPPGDPRELILTSETPGDMHQGPSAHRPIGPSATGEYRDMLGHATGPNLGKSRRPVPICGESRRPVPIWANPGGRSNLDKSRRPVPIWTNLGEKSRFAIQIRRTTQTGNFYADEGYPNGSVAVQPLCMLVLRLLRSCAYLQPQPKPRFAFR